MSTEPVFLKEFILDTKEALTELIKYLISLGAILPGDDFSVKRFNTLILIYHITIDNGIYIEDKEERKKIIQSYYSILSKEEETFAGKFVYNGKTFAFKDNNLMERIDIPDLKNVIDLYEFEYKLLLDQKGITLSPFMRRKIVFDVCLRYNLEPMIFLQEYFAILKVKVNSIEHKKIIDSFDKKNFNFIKKNQSEDNSYSEVDDQESRRNSYNEYYGYEGPGWYEED